MSAVAIPRQQTKSEMTRGVKMGLKKSDYPYASMAEASKDGFKQVGGPEGFFNHAIVGWQQRGYRKQYNIRKDAILEEAKRRGLDKEIDAQARVRKTA